MGLFGMIGGPQLGLYVLGIVYPQANTKVINIATVFFTINIITNIRYNYHSYNLLNTHTHKIYISIYACTYILFFEILKTFVSLYIFIGLNENIKSHLGLSIILMTRSTMEALLSGRKGRI